jgi:hypothetical protein
MANITDPTAVRFCNEQVRVAADKTVQFYWWCKQLKVEYVANPSLATLIPNDSSPLIDGAAQDGRTVLTGADVNAVLTNINALITSLEANSSAILNIFAKVAVNPR